MNTPKLSEYALGTLFAACVACTPALATEGGGSMYPNGLENFVAGALPPPGLYGLVYATQYNADRLMDNSGNNLNVPGFKVTANVVAPRLVWLPGLTALGGDVVTHVAVPLVDVKVAVAGNQQSKSGVGDIIIGGGIAWHHSPSLHSIAALDVYLPTGDYNKTNLANLGRNYYAFEPVYAISRIDPTGWNADIKAGILINQRNNATDYLSGNEFHFDYALGWGIGNGIVLGIGGFAYQQFSDDKQAGVTISDNRGRAFGIGPSIKYDSGKGWLLTAKWQKESQVRNRAEGNAFWLKAVFPL